MGADGTRAVVWVRRDCVREFRTFGELEFSNVDSVLSAELSYMSFRTGACVRGSQPVGDRADCVRLLRAEDYPAMSASNSGDMNDYRLALLRAACESPRFRGLRVGECRAS